MNSTFGAIIGTAIATFIVGCASQSRLIPPVNPDEPVSAFILDYGYHSSLVLPTRRATWVEYAYGDFNWFAQGRVGLDQALSTVFGYTASTLGRREFEGPMTRETLARQSSARLLEVVVSQVDVDLLTQTLDAEFQRMTRFKSPIFNQHAKTSFVHYREPYSVLKNCNHAVLLWLRALGCSIESAAPWADFEVQSARR